MSDALRVKVLEHFPEAFEELDHIFAKHLKLPVKRYKLIKQYYELYLLYGNWPEKKVLDNSPEECYDIMIRALSIPVEGKEDNWTDCSCNPPATFTSFRVSGETLRRLYLETILVLVGDRQVEKEGDRHASATQQDNCAQEREKV